MNEFEYVPREEYQTVVADERLLIQNFIKYRFGWQTTYLYLISPLFDLKDSTFSVHVNNVAFADDVRLTKEIGKENPDVKYKDTVKIECEISIWKERSPSDIDTYQHTFELPFECTTNEALRKNEIEIFDEQRLLLRQTNDRLFAFYRQHLAEGEQTLTGKNGIQSRFVQACFRTTLHQGFIPLYEWLEFTRCLQRFRYAIGNANLYKPYLDNPEWHGHMFQDGMVYPSEPTLYDERYLIHCEIAYEALYKFWDRIGDLLHDVAGTSVAAHLVDFAKVIDALNRSGLYTANSGFQWLLSFKQSEYSVFNGERRKIVHYDTLSTKIQHEHMESFSDLIKIRERQQWLEGQIDYFIQQFNNCIEGLEQLTVFIENLPPRQDPNEDL